MERLGEWLEVRFRIEPDDPLELDLVRARPGRNLTHVHELRALSEESNEPVRRVNAKLGDRVVCEVVTYRGPLL